MTLALHTEVKYLKGVGPQRAALFAKRGIQTVEDLLNYLPFRYEDRIRFTPVSEVRPGGTYTVLAEVVSGGVVRYARARHEVFHLVVKEPTSDVRSPSPILHCRFFHSGYLEGRLKPGQRLVLHGNAEVDPMRPARIEMINPEFELLPPGTTALDSTEVGRIVPVYEAIGSLSSRVLRRLIHAALSALLPEMPDLLPREILSRCHLPSRREAILFAHFPPENQDVDALNAFRSPAHQRLIFEEFFFHQLGMALRRRQMRCEPGIPLRVREPAIREAVKRILPFKPTGAQKRVLAEIAADLEKPAPMNRLLQGDVGSGKTIVALEAATIAIENGCQVALMAPTEILAVQHFLSARRVFQRAGYAVEMLISGLSPAHKRSARARIRSGAAQFVVGTHALIEEAVVFSRLALVIVDEQHRFGVLQRKELIEKGRTMSGEQRVTPHVLVMTATPIPRTLALTLYGDLDVSVIDEMPPGRTPVITRAVPENELNRVWAFLRSEVARGRQAYVVYPVIDESKQELKAATAEYERLSKTVWPELRTGLLHGRMKSEEKESVMNQFRGGHLQVLVSTTVIEVGVDVPNATVMVIEHAERFGLAQLHQLRGRIGRGAGPSHCILVTSPRLTEDARTRMETLCATTDGFRIAETDLKLRGPGEFFGTRQHGLLGFHVANPLRDHELLGLARHEARALVAAAERSDAASGYASPARARELLNSLAAHLGPEWRQRYQLARVG
jgi:ATP-dependent DNA helicase RecG